MTSIPMRVHALAPIGAVIELPCAGTWLENPFVYDAAAREIKALVPLGCTEIVDEQCRAHGDQALIVRLTFRRLC